MQLTFNAATLRDQLAGKLQQTLDVVTFIASGLGGVSFENFRSFIPFGALNPATNARLEFPEAKRATETWVLRGFTTDVIDQVGWFLEEVHVNALLFATPSQLLPKPEDWHKSVEPQRDKFHKLGIPDKIQRLSDKFGVSSPLADHLLSVNRLRNCLVHRQGIVGRQDIDSSGQLVVMLRTFFLCAREVHTGAETIIERPGQFSGALFVKVTDLPLRFSLGARVELSFDQLRHLSMTVYLFASELAESTESFAQANGATTVARERRLTDLPIVLRGHVA